MLGIAATFGAAVLAIASLGEPDVSASVARVERTPPPQHPLSTLLSTPAPEPAVQAQPEPAVPVEPEAVAQPEAPPAATSATPATDDPSDYEVRVTEEPHPWGAAEAKPADPRASAEAARAGWLRVSTKPARARVTVDGAFRGESPLVISDLAYGAHEISITREGYHPQLRTVDLQSSSDTAHFVLLQDDPEVLVQFYAPTQGAQIHSGDALVCVTPCPVTALAEGSHVFRVTLPNTTRYNVSKEIRAGGSEPLRVPLNPE